MIIHFLVFCDSLSTAAYIQDCMSRFFSFFLHWQQAVCLRNLTMRRSFLLPRFLAKLHQLTPVDSTNAQGDASVKARVRRRSLWNVAIVPCGWRTRPNFPLTGCDQTTHQPLRFTAWVQAKWISFLSAVCLFLISGTKCFRTNRFNHFHSLFLHN